MLVFSIADLLLVFCMEDLLFFSIENIFLLSHCALFCVPENFINLSFIASIVALISIIVIFLVVVVVCVTVSFCLSSSKLIVFLENNKQLHAKKRQKKK